MTEKKIEQVPTITLGKIFSKAEIDEVEKLWIECNRTGKYLEFHARCQRQIVEPAMERINSITGQENDASYITYCLEFALTQVNKPDHTAT